MRDGPHPKLSGDRDDLGQPCPDPAVSVSAHFRLSSPPSPPPPQAAAAVVPASAGRRVVASRRAWWNSGRQGEQSPARRCHGSCGRRSADAPNAGASAVTDSAAGVLTVDDAEFLARTLEHRRPSPQLREGNSPKIV